MKGTQPEVTARRVVAGVDGSPNSLLALRRAVYAARLCGACVELIRVLPPGATPATEIAGLRALAMAVRCEFPGGPRVPVRYTVECGDPAEILVKLSVGAELLIIGGRPLPPSARQAPRR
jgi:nucleotide-binding universal stress UspA family protein